MPNWQNEELKFFWINSKDHSNIIHWIELFFSLCRQWQGIPQWYSPRTRARDQWEGWRQPSSFPREAAPRHDQRIPSHHPVISPHRPSEVHKYIHRHFIFTPFIFTCDLQNIVIFLLYIYTIMLMSYGGKTVVFIYYWYNMKELGSRKGITGHFVMDSCHSFKSDLMCQLKHCVVLLVSIIIKFDRAEYSWFM